MGSRLRNPRTVIRSSPALMLAAALAVITAGFADGSYAGERWREQHGSARSTGSGRHNFNGAWKRPGFGYGRFSERGRFGQRPPGFAGRGLGGPNMMGRGGPGQHPPGAGPRLADRGNGTWNHRGPNAFGRPFTQGRSQHWPLPGERGYTGVPPQGETRFISNEMVFQVGAGMSDEAVANMVRRYGLSAVSSQSYGFTGTRLVRFRITSGRPVADVIRDIEAQNAGAVAQPNYVYKLQQDVSLAARTTEGDPGQYVVAKLHLADAHRIARGDNVLVAMIDSEVDAKHPDLAGAIVEQYDAISGPDRPHVHGTGMAGAIAAHRRLVGIAPGARILAIHAFSADGNGAQGTTEQILKGIDWAISKGARVINMSFAGPRDPMLQLALKKAHEKGIVLVAAAGNAGANSPPLFPAADPNVIAVTATDANDGLFADANRGDYVAVAAPGVDILVPAPNGRYQISTGTSVAAAHVSGIVALLLEHKPAIDADAVRTILAATARDLGAKGRDDEFGAGLVDPYQALLALDAKPAEVRATMPAQTPSTARNMPVSTR